MSSELVVAAPDVDAAVAADAKAVADVAPTARLVVKLLHLSHVLRADVSRFAEAFGCVVNENVLYGHFERLQVSVFGAPILPANPVDSSTICQNIKKILNQNY